MNILDIDTPALLVDLDAMESNLQKMAAFFNGQNARLRPHFKNHKSPALAWKQLGAGAIGMTCATLREAEVLVQHGVKSILIANEIAGSRQVNSFADLSQQAEVIVAVDSERSVRELASIAKSRNVALNIVVDINVGLNRCGLPPGQPARELALSASTQGLRVRGVMGYDGHLQVLPEGPERDEKAAAVARALVESKALIEGTGIPVEIVSAGGSGTFMTEGAYPGITEIQAGSYLLMDTLYALRGSPFERTLTLLATVVSTPAPDRAVINCGMKELSAERGLSLVKGRNGVELKALHAEHGLLQLCDPEAQLQIGDQVELWVHYSDATVNLHRQMHGVRHSKIETIFEIVH